MFVAPLSLPPELLPFDPAPMRRTTLLGRLAGAVLHHPQPWYAVLRRVFPILRLGHYVLVTRAEDVCEVLSRDADFPVRFGARFEAMDPDGVNFILGMANTPEYRAIRAETMKVFSLADIGRIAAHAAGLAEAAVQAGDGQIDAVAELIVPVMAGVARDYYGVDLPMPDGALWMMAISAYDFMPTPTPAVEAAARAGSQRVASMVRAALAAPPPDTVAARFVAAREGSAVLGGEVVRATITGMLTGFVPTTALATANVLEVLLGHPEMMAAAVAAAQADDNAKLDRCLFEALRWNPINPGPLRLCAAETTIAAGTRREKKVRPDDLLLASTGSAMFDPRRVKDPNRFNPDRDAGDYLHFGVGQHWCIGFAIARATMTQVLKPLLARGAPRRAVGAAGKMASFGPFPEHLAVTYDPADHSASR